MKTEIEVLIIDPNETQVMQSSKLVIFAKKHLHFLSIPTKFKLKQLYLKAQSLINKFQKSKKISLDLNQHLQSGDVVLCPHYYLFPEVIKLIDDKRLILYLPDYVPYLYPDKFKNEIQIGEKIGQKIAKQSNLIITNSLYTKNYLPETNLSVDPTKIRVFPLPILSNPVSQLHKFDLVKGRRYFFYPTAIRPNKRIDVLLQAFDKLVADYADLYLVLTSNPNSEPNARSIFQQMSNTDRVLIFENVTDSQLKALYLNCEAVIVSTESEGNFPTQLTEALTLGKPTLSAFIEVIIQEIGSESLLHFESGSVDSLYTQMKFLLKNLSIETQRSIDTYDRFMKDSDEKARKALKQIFEEVSKN
jgi:glycosyltransferase involved in cell wall biosynthesis